MTVLTIYHPCMFYLGRFPSHCPMTDRTVACKVVGRSFIFMAGLALHVIDGNKQGMIRLRNRRPGTSRMTGNAWLFIVFGGRFLGMTFNAVHTQRIFMVKLFYRFPRLWSMAYHTLGIIMAGWFLRTMAVLAV